MEKRMDVFPFPDKEGSRAELAQDYVYAKIDHSKDDEIFELAWQAGVKAADEFMHEGESPKDMQTLLKSKGVKIETIDTDYVVGKRRYFCEFFSGKNKIRIYQKSIQLWCEKNDFSIDAGLNLILCHEYYHYLEWNRYGLTSRLYQVPIVKIGKLEMGKTGVAALSEIAANAFAWTLYEQSNTLSDMLSHKPEEAL
jgi:hypothetical protein